MSERTISVRLRAEVSDFKRSMAEAANSSDKMSAQFDKNGQKIQTVSGRMVRSAQINREAWTTAGTALTGVGLAVTALGAAALKTGIEYNTLQQTTRKALGTLLGDAEAANAQMDKLDEFARSSPFAKQVFISAQQQMLGFGIEAKKVIPYLDAIQNGVAAMGGSNNDIAELTRIMSQISASAKITAMDLREFGNRGVDAATIIGSQMGMTGAEIRESITAGTLDAEAALDALAEGMQERFGGAAAGVKDTFMGSIDRVKAAWRDLASELAEPLVDPEGGGILIDLANNTANLMRQFQALPRPVKVATVALTGATGAASLAAGGFLILTPRILDTISATQRLAADFPRLASGLGRVGKSAGVASAALVAIAVPLAIATRMGDEQVAMIREMVEGWESLDRLGRENLVADLKRVNSELDHALLSQGRWTDSLVDSYRRLGEEEALIETNEQIAAIEQATANTTLNLQKLRRETGLTFDELEKLAFDNAVDLSAAVNTDVARLARDSLIEIADGADLLDGAIINVNGSLSENMRLMSEAAGVALTERAALSGLEAAFDTASETIGENGATLDLTTEKGRENDAALRDIAGSTFDLIEAMDESGASSESMREEMTRARDAFIENAEAAGATRGEAEDLADAYGLIPSTVSTDIDADTSAALTKIARLRDILRSIPQTIITADMRNDGGYYANRASGGPIEKYGTGGSIMGYSPTPTADNIPIMATAGEYMQPVASVRHYGTEVMEAMRTRDDAQLLKSLAVKGFAGGGGIGGGGAMGNSPSVSVNASVGNVTARLSADDIHALGDYIVQSASITADGRIVSREQATQLAGRMA